MSTAAARSGPMALGLVEMRGEVAGVLVLDAAAKSSNLQFALGKPVCPGKYLLLLGGRVADVQAAVSASEALHNGMQAVALVLPKVHPDVWPALMGTSPAAPEGSLAVMETHSAASAVLVADSLAKAAGVQLLGVRLASGLGGKGLVFCTGATADLEEATAVAEKVAGDHLADARVIGSPDHRLWQLVM